MFFLNFETIESGSKFNTYPLMKERDLSNGWSGSLSGYHGYCVAVHKHNLHPWTLSATPTADVHGMEVGGIGAV